MVSVLAMTCLISRPSPKACTANVSSSTRPRVTSSDPISCRASAPSNPLAAAAGEASLELAAGVAVAGGLLPQQALNQASR